MELLVEVVAELHEPLLEVLVLGVVGEELGGVVFKLLHEDALV